MQGLNSLCTVVFLCRLTALSTPGEPREDVSDYTDLELIQHINVDIARLTKLLNGECM